MLQNETNLTEMQVFQQMNPNELALKHSIDLHGQSKKSAVDIARSKLDEVAEALHSEELKPNNADGMNHVFKIIVGPGKNSRNGAQLVRIIPGLLDELDLDYHLVKEQGVFLVRLTK